MGSLNRFAECARPVSDLLALIDYGDGSEPRYPTRQERDRLAYNGQQIKLDLQAAGEGFVWQYKNGINKFPVGKGEKLENIKVGLRTATLIGH